MSFFDFLRSPDINQGIKEYEAVSGAILLDVRTAQEYKEGHISGSKNIDLQSLTQGRSVSPKKDTPIFVYCHSGARSSQAVKFLQKAGYTKVKNIGGIASYSGKVER